jgi:hypothetical protein
MSTPPPPPGAGEQEADARDRRQAFRYPILQRCFAYPDGSSAVLAWQVIAYNVSATGIGMVLPCPVERGAVLEVDAWKLRRAPRLRVRVVHARLSHLHWFCGCELLTPLSEEELAAWLAGPTDWVDTQAGETPRAPRIRG